MFAIFLFRAPYIGWSIFISTLFGSMRCIAFTMRAQIHFLAELSNEVRALSQRLGREIVLIAESDLNDARVRLPTGPEADGLGMHGQWSDDFHHSLHTLMTGRNCRLLRGFRNNSPSRQNNFERLVLRRNLCASSRTSPRKFTA